MAAPPTTQAPTPPPSEGPDKESSQAEETFTVVDQGPFKTGVYWFTFLTSLACLIILLLYYGSFDWVRILFWVGYILAGGLLIWSGIGLGHRYDLAGRVGQSAARFRASREEGTEDERIVYRENIIVRGFKFVGRLIALLFLFVWNTFLRLWYIATQTILWALILGYDVIYYTLYAAWTIVYYAWRLARRIILLALRVTWKILKILTKFPIARGLWANRYRPRIMGSWNRQRAESRERAARRLDERRRIAATKGKDPDAWQADWEARHRFPLPHPHEARKGLRDWMLERQRIDYNRRDRWSAFRKGLPIPPRLHSDRRKRKREEREQKRREERERDQSGQKERRTPKRERDMRPRTRSAGDARPFPDEE